MNDNLRQERLVADLQALEHLRNISPLFDFECSGEPADRYAITFSGKGLQRNAVTGQVEFIERHECDVRLGLSYPERGPDIRWMTPLYHPNISFGGFIRLRDVGMVWSDDLTLDVVCERLWDVARFAYYDLEHATNYSAKRWLEEQSTHNLPVDPRPLREIAAPARSNVVHYARRGEGGGVDLPSIRDSGDVFYIGEDTPAPPIAWEPSARADDDEDVLYIME